MNDTVKKWLWLFLYFLILLAPLIIILIGPRQEPREFWRELSVALGFSGLALIGVQFIPTSRLRLFTNLFSMDEVYYYHLRASVIGFVFVLAHPLILFAFNPDSLRLLNPITAPARATFGVISLLALVGLVVTSVFRKQLRIRYEVWRFLHTVFAIVVVLMAMLHILGVDYYLSLPWQRALWIALTIVWIGLILNNRIVRPLWRLRYPYKLTEIRPETEGVWTLTLIPEGHTGIKFMPGQFAWLTIDRPPFALRQHPFTIASSAENTDYLEFTIGESGDFTSQVSTIPTGTTTYIDGPHGTFSIDFHDGPGYVFVAGGIGSPPMMSMLRTMADRGNTKPIYFFYGNIDEASITYKSELEQLKQKLNLHIIHTLENSPDEWEGETGFVDANVLQRHLPQNRNDLIYFVCGPVPMISAVLDALREVKVPLENVHTEQYEMV